MIRAGGATALKKGLDAASVLWDVRTSHDDISSEALRHRATRSGFNSHFEIV